MIHLVPWLLVLHALGPVLQMLTQVPVLLVAVTDTMISVKNVTSVNHQTTILVDVLQTVQLSPPHIHVHGLDILTLTQLHVKQSVGTVFMILEKIVMKELQMVMEFLVVNQIARFLPVLIVIGLVLLLLTPLHATQVAEMDIMTIMRIAISV